MGSQDEHRQERTQGRRRRAAKAPAGGFPSLWHFGHCRRPSWCFRLRTPPQAGAAVDRCVGTFGAIVQAHGSGHARTCAPRRRCHHIARCARPSCASRTFFPAPPLPLALAEARRPKTGGRVSYRGYDTRPTPVPRSRALNEQVAQYQQAGGGPARQVMIFLVNRLRVPQPRALRYSSAR